MITGILIVAGAYLLGGVPFGYVLVKLKSGRDVRSMGSGNIGATNVLRTSGKAIGILTLLLDIGKGALAVWAADRLTGGSPAWTSAAAVAVMLGHAYPVYLKFRGGKAVASFVGAFLYLTPEPLIACIMLLALVVAYTRYVSLGSIVAAGMFPFGVWLILHPPMPVLAAAFFSGAFIVWRHRANIARIRAGNENVLTFRRPA